VSGRTRRVAAGGAVLVLLVSLLVTAALMWTNRTTAQRESARGEALAAAPERIEALLSYDAATVDADLEQAARGATGTFAEGFRDFAANTVAPKSKSEGISTRARIAETGYLDGAADQARLLAFVDQITTSTLSPAPTSTSSRVIVTMERVGDEWLIAEMTPI
jgi:Mce-associated membrane protein